MSEPQIVNILGEQVSLEPTGFDPSEKFLVSFDEKYKFPEMTSGEQTALKAIFRKLFTSTSLLGSAKTTSPPPCSEQEKELLLKSLVYRFTSLRNELIAERQSQSDSLRLRQIIDHLQRLKEYIDFAKTTTQCQELDEGILAETLKDLSDEQILELLRQFVFFILQGQHPQKEYVGRDPNPKGFVARLTKKPVDNFAGFMAMYRQKKHPVPLPIEKILQVTQLDIQAMKDEIEKSFQGKLKGIVETIATVLPPDHPFWENVDQDSLDGVVDGLLDLIQQLQEDVEECNEQSLKDQQIIVDLDTERERLENELSLLTGRHKLLESNLSSLQQSAVTDGISSEEFDEFQEEAKRIIDELNTRIKELQLELIALNQRLAEAEEQQEQNSQGLQQKTEALEKCKQLEVENKSLLDLVKKYEEQLANAQKRILDCELIERRFTELESLYEAKEKELAELRSQAGPLTQEIDKHLREKADINVEKDMLEIRLEELQELFDMAQAFIQSIGQDKAIVLTSLEQIQRNRADLKIENDAILGKINTLRQDLTQAQTVPSDMASRVTEIVKDLQNELIGKQDQLAELEKQIQEKDKLIGVAKQQMDESGVLLDQIRAGRISADANGSQYGTDKEFLEHAIKAVQAEQELKKIKAELETTVVQLTASNESLQRDMLALQQRLSNELNIKTEQLTAKTQELETEKGVTAGLRGDVVERDEQIAILQQQVLEKEGEVKTSRETLEQERQASEQRMAELEERKIRECDEQLATLRSQLDQTIQQFGEAEQKLVTKDNELQTALTQLEEEKKASAQKIAELEETKLRECEERLVKVREEEEQKRQELLSVQGAEKGTLEAQTQNLLKEKLDIQTERDSLRDQLITEKDRYTSLQEQIQTKEQEHQTVLSQLQQQLDESKQENKEANDKLQSLLKQVTTLETERNTYKAELEGEKAKLSDMNNHILELEDALMKQKQEIATLQTQKKDALKQVASLSDEVSNAVKDITELRTQVMTDNLEKDALFKIIGEIATWISSGGKMEKPVIDAQLNTNYGVNRILDAFLSSLPEEEEEVEDTTSASLSRCYLVFFMTYVYARHFPTKQDGDSSYQSQLTAFLKSIQTELYKQLEAGIAGKLEAVGSGGIPVQLKSKYMMTVLMPLIKQMELVHESGKKGIDFLKFSTIDQDQLATLHKLHDIVLDKLKIQPKDTLQTLANYMLKRSGNVDDDIANLYLRFYQDSTTNKEYPVIVYMNPASKDTPKLTFGTETDFTQYLSSPATKSVQQKASTVLQDQLGKKPVFSFSLLIYLFLFFVKDYLSSVEGELNKAGCPLPPLLKLR